MNKTSALACVLFLMACGRGGDDAADSVAGAPSTLAATALPARAADLTKPVDQYTGAEFFSHVRGLQYVGGNERERRCRGCAATQRTRVRVDGVEGADSVGPSNVPQFGIIVARGLNRGGQQEDRYGMRPGARFEYYLIVLPGTTPGASMTWRVEELEIVGQERSRRQLATGRVVPCNHPFARGAASDFRTCENAPPTGANPAAFGFVPQGEAGDDPWWYRCALGCCIAEESSGA